MGSNFVPDGEYFLKNRTSLRSLHLKGNPAGVGQAQTISHLKLTGRRLGFPINFNVLLIKNGIKRIIL